MFPDSPFSSGRSLNLLWFRFFSANYFSTKPLFCTDLWPLLQNMCVSYKYTLLPRFNYYNEILLLHVSNDANNGTFYCLKPVEVRSCLLKVWIDLMPFIVFYYQRCPLLTESLDKDGSFQSLLSAEVRPAYWKFGQGLVPFIVCHQHRCGPAYWKFRHA